MQLSCHFPSPEPFTHSSGWTCSFLEDLIARRTAVRDLAARALRSTLTSLKKKRNFLALVTHLQDEIKLTSETKRQVANATLPVSGEDGSLTVNNDIVIDTTPPYVVAVLSLREGVYTMGQSVDLQVSTVARENKYTFCIRNK